MLLAVRAPSRVRYKNYSDIFAIFKIVLFKQKHMSSDLNMYFRIENKIGDGQVKQWVQMIEERRHFISFTAYA
jgi:hypothetical protein